jgi:hypothetical protein
MTDSMILEYLGQAVTLKVTGPDNQFDPPTVTTYSIPARWQTRRRWLRDKNGEIIESSAVVFIGPAHAVKVGDKITDPSGRDWVALQVSEAINLDGAVEWYEVSL